MSQRLRIAMFVGCFPVISETFILRQIAGLLELGHEVDIYADTRGELGGAVQPEVEQYRLLQRATFMDLPPEAAPWEMPVWPLTGRTWTPGASEPVRNSVRLARAVPRVLHCLATAPRLTLQALRPSQYGFQAASLSALYRLSHLARLRRHYDVLHAHFGPNGNSFRFARDLWRAPLIVSFHGYDFSTLPRQQGAGMYRRLFDAADAVTVNSAFTRARVARLGCPEAKLHRLQMGLDLGSFPFAARTRHANEPVRLLTVARLVPVKGHEYALRAVAKVRARHPEIRYDIVGDGPLRKKLEELVIALGLADAVTLHGARDGAFVRERMSAAHLALLASVSIEDDQEGQGLFLQEAQACGLPVVATQHGALPEGLVADQSGFLAPERNVEMLAQRLEFLLTHPGVWPEMGRYGRAFVEQHYDIRQLTERLAELYRATQRSFESGSG